MELREVVRRRSMCRNFTDRPVPPEVVDRMLDQARRAPSAGHTQGWSFLVLEGRDQVERFWRVDSDPEWLANPTPPGLVLAPVIIVALCSARRYLDRYSEPDKIDRAPKTQEQWPAPFWVVDVSFATMTLLFAAVEEGLGALFFGLRGDPAELREEFGIPEEWTAIGAVALGWPAADRGPAGSAWRGRRPLTEVVHRGGW